MAARGEPRLDITTGRPRLLPAAAGHQGAIGAVDQFLERVAIAQLAEAEAHRYQLIMRDDLVRIVERQLQRKVIAFMSQNHIDPDLGVEVFVLEPGGPV